MTKGVLINDTAIVTKRGTSIVGCMAWETPYIEFVTPCNGIVRWQSDTIGSWADLEIGNVVNLRAYIYGPALKQTIKRVTISKVAI